MSTDDAPRTVSTPLGLPITDDSTYELDLDTGSLIFDEGAVRFTADFGVFKNGETPEWLVVYPDSSEVVELDDRGRRLRTQKFKAVPV